MQKKRKEKAKRENENARLNTIQTLTILWK